MNKSPANRLIETVFKVKLRLKTAGFAIKSQARSEAEESTLRDAKPPVPPTSVRTALLSKGDYLDTLSHLDD